METLPANKRDKFHSVGGVVSKILKIFLTMFYKQQYKKHRSTWHDLNGCIFCYMSSCDAKRFMIDMKAQDIKE